MCPLIHRLVLNIERRRNSSICETAIGQIRVERGFGNFRSQADILFAWAMFLNKKIVQKSRAMVSIPDEIKLEKKKLMFLGEPA